MQFLQLHLHKGPLVLWWKHDYTYQDSHPVQNGCLDSRPFYSRMSSFQIPSRDVPILHTNPKNKMPTHLRLLSVIRFASCDSHSRIDLSPHNSASEHFHFHWCNGSPGTQGLCSRHSNASAHVRHPRDCNHGVFTATLCSVFHLYGKRKVRVSHHIFCCVVCSSLRNSSKPRCVDRSCWDLCIFKSFFTHDRLRFADCPVPPRTSE